MENTGQGGRKMEGDYAKHDARISYLILPANVPDRTNNAGWTCNPCGAKSRSHRMKYKAALASAERHNGGPYNYEGQA